MQIDNVGVQEVKEKIGNPLKHLWTKIEKAGLANDCLEEYDFIWRFLDGLEANVGDAPDPSVIVNGQVYRKEGA